MQLVRARVTNFRSVEDSGWFDVAQITCLVGKNEAGKTAILQALAGLNPHPATPFQYDKERDYPRRFLTDYATRHPKEEAFVVQTEWQLESGERAALIAQLGPAAITDGPVNISRRYNAKEPEWQLPIAYKRVVEFLITDAAVPAAEADPLNVATTTDELRQILEKISSRTEKQELVYTKIMSFTGHNSQGHALSILRPKLPSLMYFSHYDRMVGQIRIETLQQKLSSGQAIDAGERVFVDFLEFAGTTLDEIAKASTFESLNARCEAASNTITDQILEYWTQNPDIELQVHVNKGEPKDPPPFNEGVIARARVRNNLHRVSTPFSERSAGFVWFFSFLVKFSRVRGDATSACLLLDEPGLTLHGKAQSDLLRYFEEKLAPAHQIIFSTHSPFMVPVERLLDVRVVEDRVKVSRSGRREPEGTKVRSDVLATDPDTLFPLQGALGYDVTQSLFIGRNTLLVEGPGDILFIKAWSGALGRRRRTSLDGRWTICPAGGIDKIQSFVSLFSGTAKIDVAVLTDLAHGDKRKIETIRKIGTVADKRLLDFGTLLGRSEADAEDVFAPGLYAAIVNDAFALEKGQQLTAGSMAKADQNTTRLVKQAEAFFRVLPPEAPAFDHFRPAEWIFMHPEVLDKKSKEVEETLERAEVVLKALNALLPPIG